MSNCIYGVMNKTSGCKKQRAREHTDINYRVCVDKVALILTSIYYIYHYTRILRSTVAPRLSMFDMNRYFLPSLINWSRSLELAMLWYTSPCPGGYQLKTVKLHHLRTNKKTMQLKHYKYLTQDLVTCITKLITYLSMFSVLKLVAMGKRDSLLILGYLNK